MKWRLLTGVGIAITVACLCGCPRIGPGIFPPSSVNTSQKSMAKQAPVEILAQAPELGPELKEGEYALVVEKFKEPVWFNENLTFQSISSPQVKLPANKKLAEMALYNSNRYLNNELLSYTLDMSDKIPVMTVNVSIRKMGKPATPEKVSKILGQMVSESKPDEIHYVFHDVPLGNGNTQTLGLIVPTAKEKFDLRGYVLINECLKCEVPQGDKKTILRVITSIDKTGKTFKALWVDDDKNGQLANYEVENMEQVLGVEGRLYQFTAPYEKSLKIVKYAGDTGYLALDATDGKGAASGLERLRTALRGEITYYIGKVKAVQVMAGRLNINYNLPVDGMQAASASFTHPLDIKSGQAVKVKAGGPVKAGLDVVASGETVQVTPSLMTATGHTVEMSEVTGRANGLIEVLDANGKVLDSGKAEYG